MPTGLTKKVSERGSRSMSARVSDFNVGRGKPHQRLLPRTQNAAGPSLHRREALQATAGLASAVIVQAPAERDEPDVPQAWRNPDSMPQNVASSLCLTA